MGMKKSNDIRKQELYFIHPFCHGEKSFNMIQMFVLGVRECLCGNYFVRHELFLYSAEIIDFTQK